MGFFNDARHFKEPANETLKSTATAASQDIKCLSGANNRSMEGESKLEASTTSNNSLFGSIKALFSSSIEKDRHNSTDSAKSTSTLVSRTPKYSTSSGYHSLEESLDVEDSYIKVSKFSDNEDSNEVGVFGTYKEYKEQQQQQTLAGDIKNIIETFVDPTRIFKITDFLALRTAGDVLNLSKCEPYGLKGCKLILIMNDGDEQINLGTIYPEKGIFSTFEITLVLHLKRNPCRRLPFLRCKQTTMNVLQQYELRKEKMYTSKSRRSSPTYCR